MLAIRNNSLLQRLSHLSALFLSISLSTCARSAAQLQTPTTSTKNEAALVEELESAKQQDWSKALDPHVSPSEEDDFLDQMNEADRAIKELTHGFEVPQFEIDKALLVPPKSLSSKKRLRLIRQLQNAAEQDERNEQAMLNDSVWSDSVAPMDTFAFDQQKARRKCDQGS
jgi:hypothetical protein